MDFVIFSDLREKSQTHLAKSGACNRPPVGFPCRRFRYFLLLRRVSFFSWRKKAAQMRKAGGEKMGRKWFRKCLQASFWKPLGFNKFPLRRWRMKRWGFNLVSTCFKERGPWLPWRPLLRLAFNTWRYRSSAMRVAPKLLRRRQVRRQLWMDWSQLEREQRSCVPQTMFEPLDTWPSSIVQTLQTQVSQVWKLLSFESTSKPSLSVGESLWFI